MAAPYVLGVRHHSPACARLVQQRIRELGPAVVLIEGPADMNGRIDELDRDHRLPIAIFSYVERGRRMRSSWAPLCAYSPEWVALREGRARGAEVRFIDLPAWSDAFEGVEDRYADRHAGRLAYVRRLCERLGADGPDALWDHLFEQPMPAAELSRRLERYFEALRDGGVLPTAPPSHGPRGDRDAAREAFMAQHVSAAMASARGPVLVVCGGYHAPWLRRAWRSAPPRTPPLPEPARGTRHGSYLVPYSSCRLERFAGYQAAMPSPAYQQAVWELGPGRAAERMRIEVVERLREAGHPVSAADLIAAEAMSRGLARLRGHEAVTRVDLLDAMAAALLTEPVESPHPWTGARRIGAGTTEAGACGERIDPVLSVILGALRGRQRGRLAPDTPRPPLVSDAREELERHDLLPGDREVREVTLDLTDPDARRRSRVLHRLRVLGIEGFARAEGPRSPLDAELRERWRLWRDDDADRRLLEAAALGPTLRAAAAARLEEHMASARGDLELLVRLVVEALFVGLDTLADRALGQVSRGVGRERRLGRLGAALALALALYRHDRLLGAADDPRLGRLVEACVERALWLFEGRRGPRARADEAELTAIVAVRDAVRYAPSLRLDRDAIRAVMERRSVDPAAPPAHRGAALGYLWSTGAFATQAAARERAVAASRASSHPDVVGEHLAGLFALARQEVIGAADLLRALDDLVTGRSQEDFLRAVPSLRAAFGWFPPRERDALARAVLELRGRGGDAPSSIARLPAEAPVIAAGLQLEGRVDELQARHGWSDEAFGDEAFGDEAWSDRAWSDRAWSEEEALERATPHVRRDETP